MEKTKVWSETGEDKSLEQDWGKDKSYERGRENKRLWWKRRKSGVRQGRVT